MPRLQSEAWKCGWEEGEEHRTSNRARQNRLSETSIAPDHERILKVIQHETTPQPADHQETVHPDSNFSLQIQKQGSNLP